MNKLPQVLLILTALGLGFIYGYHEWKHDGREEEQTGHEDFYERWAKFLEKGDGVVDDTNNWYGENETGEFLKFPNRVTGIGKRFYGDVTSLKKPPDYEEVLEEEQEAQLKEEEQQKEQKEQKEQQEQNSREKVIKASAYQEELDRIDFLLKEASTYIQIATIDVNLRKEYAKSAFDCTSEALDIFGKIPEEAQDRPETLQRLDSITKTRHAAMKLAPIEK